MASAANGGHEDTAHIGAGFLHGLLDGVELEHHGARRQRVAFHRLHLATTDQIASAVLRDGGRHLAAVLLEAHVRAIKALQREIGGFLFHGDRRGLSRSQGNKHGYQPKQLLHVLHPPKLHIRHP